MKSGAVRWLLGADRALLHAACEAGDGALWFVDREGVIRDVSGRPEGLDVSTLAALPDPAGRILHAALTEGVAGEVETTLGPPGAEQPAVLRLVPVLAGTIRAVLHVRPLGRERTLETQLRQAQRLQSVGELAAGIAHDFNNLLTAILGAAEDLQSQVAFGKSSELAQICESAGRGAALVRQLLAFSRQQTLQPRVVAANEAVRGAAALLRRVIGTHINLHLQLEEPGRYILVDPGQFDQVLVNLAVNAAHAMPNGGTLTIETGHRTVLRPTPVGSETIPPGRYATIAIADTGVGIPPEILPHIFEPFFTTRRPEGGTGLGLATVHGIVCQSGGFLAVESEHGRGTCFSVLLPRHEADPEPIAEPHPGPRQPEAGPPLPSRLLLVEDEAAVRRLAERALERAGWTVLGCESAQEALERFAETPDITAVVSDVIMPGLDGPTLVARLRVTAPNLAAVLISGYADARSRERLARENVIFVPKPFSMQELVTAVEAAWRGGR